MTMSLDLTFTIKGGDLDVAEITRVLGVTPTRAFVKGSDFATKTGTHKRAYSAWMLDSSSAVQSSDPEVHFAFLCEFLDKSCREISRLRALQQVQIWVRVSTSARGGGFSFTMSKSVLHALHDTVDFVDFSVTR